MIDLEKLIKEISDREVIDILTDLGADRYTETDEVIIFPTICHNEESSDASLKLYYYKENKLFHCYTECGESFNLFTLIEKVFALRGMRRVKTKNDKETPSDFTFYDIVKYITDRSNTIFFSNDENAYYKSEKEKYVKQKRLLELPSVNEGILNIFDDYYAIEWLEEGIKKEAMDAFNIKYSISRNKIIIPHYDIDNRLIGIRGRALNPDEAKDFKYMPIEIEGKWYTHPLSENLYGLNLAKENISRLKTAIVFEGEKSCLKYYDYFGQDKNISCACCGSSIKKNQVDLLVKKCGVNEIIIALDKEYLDSKTKDGELYFNKIYDMCKKYQNYANFSFIFDMNGVLDLKDSPVDKGKEVFEKLLKKRVHIK